MPLYIMPTLIYYYFLQMLYNYFLLDKANTETQTIIQSELNK